MKYSNYDVQENKNGTWTAFVPNTPYDIATAKSEDELNDLMGKLGKAREEGIMQGVKEHKQEMRYKLGL